MIGAAVLGVPVKPTIKEIGGDGFVVKTLKRSALWEVQTPQVTWSHVSTLWGTCRSLRIKQLIAVAVGPLPGSGDCPSSAHRGPRARGPRQPGSH